MLRPSLSGSECPTGCAGAPAVSPEFMLRPSLSDTAVRVGSLPFLGRVAGVYAPAFVERSPPSWSPTTCLRVAGVYAPAFVERGMGTMTRRNSLLVSPEFMLRPSLSAPAPMVRHREAQGVSPEFMLRPSLSEDASKGGSPTFQTCVAGVYAPAFVERTCRTAAPRRGWSVSPEFMLRPSLSGPAKEHVDRDRYRVAGVYAPAFVERPCRR